MVKTRLHRKKRSNRTRKMRGGGLDSCAVRNYKNKMNPLWKHPYAFGNTVTVVEDQLQVASPNQKLCFGDEFTTCSAIIVVMQNNYKVAAHINPYNYMIQGEFGTKIQRYNPVTVLPEINTILTTNPNFMNSTIKIIYLVSSMGSFSILKNSQRRYKTNLNNEQSAAFRPAAQNASVSQEELTNRNAHEFFKAVFPGKVTPQTRIEFHTNKQVEHYSSGGVEHFLVDESGALDLIAHS